MNPKSLLAGLAFTLTLSAPIFAQDPSADTVVTTVNGTDITLGHMIATRAALPQQYQSLPAETLFPGILEQLVRQTLLAQVQDTMSKRVEVSLENEERTLQASESISALLAEQLTEEALRAAYEAQYGGASGGEMEFNASHILVATEDEAKDVQKRVADGQDFAEAAKEFSTGPSGPNGGSLGWFGAGMMVAPFEEAVKAMDTGSVSDPVQTQFGWHIIKLNETRANPAPSFEEVAQDIRAELQDAAILAKVEELEAAATIVSPEAALDPNLINNVDLLAN